jgi:hypothetical protein
MQRVLIILVFLLHTDICWADESTPLPKYNVDQICANSNMFKYSGGVRKCILQEQRAYDQLKNSDFAADGMPFSWDTALEDVRQGCIAWVDEMSSRSTAFSAQPYNFLKNCVILRMQAQLPKTDLPDVHFQP